MSTTACVQKGVPCMQLSFSKPHVSLPKFNGLRTQTSLQGLRHRGIPRTTAPLRPLTASALSKQIVCVVSASSSAETSSDSSSSSSLPSPPPPLTGAILGGEKEFSGAQGLARAIPAPVIKGASAVLVLAGLGAGYLAGGRVVHQSPLAGQVAGAVILGGLGGAAGITLQKASLDAAATEIFNFVARLPDLSELRRTQVEGIAKTYGVSLDSERIVNEMKEIYERFLWSILPPGNDPLTGAEFDSIKQFKSNLGIEDEDAATVHIELGRRIFRQRLETGDKGAAIQERKAFQKLVYVSDLVFGPKAKFLLPWKRIFKVTDAQVDVAVRTNAQELFQAELRESQASPDLTVLRGLREQQRKIKLPDEVASEMFVSEARKRLEGYVSEALGVLKARTRVKDMRKVIQALDQLRAYHNALAAAASSAPAGELVPGVGPVTLLEEDAVEDRTMDDLRTLYKTYLSELLEKNEELDDGHLAALADLRNIFGMGKREAEEASEEVTKKVYRRKLGQAVTSGALEAAPSKAEFLEKLCDSLKFNPELAFQIHEEIYRQKLQQCLEDGSLSDEDVQALLRLRVLLCIPKAVEEKAHADICGGIFTKVVDDAIGAGIDGYDGEMREKVREAAKGLRLPAQAALEIAAKAARAIFLTYIRRARSSMGRTEAARELKKMVIFSNLTVSQLLEDIKGEKEKSPEKGEEAAKKEAEGEKETGGEEEEDVEGLDFDDQIPLIQSLKKTRGKQREGKAQKEINVKEDLELRERQDLYRTFLLFCIQGDTAGMPMGTQLVVQRDQSDFVRLGQLGDILGLSQLEAAMVHQGLAEQAFTNQAETLLADGQLSKTRAEQLKEMQKQLGLPDAAAQKVIQKITSTKMAGAIGAAVQQGRLTVEDIRGLKESGVNIETMVAQKVREQMFEKLVAKELERGNGEFDAAVVLSLPADLGLDEAAAKKMVKELAQERLKGSLVQAVSLLRQRKPKETLSSLFNILASDAAEPAQGPLDWQVKEELYDLYALFLSEEKEADSAQPKEQRLKEILGISDSVADQLREMVQSGGFSLDGTQEEKFVF